MSTDTNPEQSPSPPTTGPSPKKFSTGQVVKLATIPLVLVVLIVVGGSLGWEEAVKRWIRPQLVPVTGEVQYQGKPLTSGFVSTRYLGGSGGTALGALDEEGRFTLATNGTPGAFVGRHKVLVHCMGRGMPPPSLIPEKFSQEDATPLTIDVTSSTDKNHFSFKVDE